MYIESPTTTTPEITTDPTLDHLYKLKELVSHSGYWCQGRVAMHVYPLDSPIGLNGYQHCVMGLAVIAVGGDARHMSTSMAEEYLQKADTRSDLYYELGRAAADQQDLDPVHVNDRYGHAAVVKMVDRAIENRKASL